MVRRRGNLIENSKGPNKHIVTLQKIKGTLTFKLGRQNERRQVKPRELAHSRQRRKNLMRLRLDRAEHMVRYNRLQKWAH